MHKETKRKRFNHKKTSSSKYCTEIKKEIEKTSKSQTGIDCCKINYFLRKTPNFYGCFSPDELENLLIDSFPIYLIVNLDLSSKDGSHWLAIRVSYTKVEVFDPLGFKIDKWPSIPVKLIEFIQKLSYQKQLFISRILQPPNSSLCGFYCIYYILARSSNSFQTITNSFSLQLDKNDLILTKLLYKIK